MGLIFEKLFPYLLSLAAGLLWWQFELCFPSGEGVLGSSLTIGAILTGFLATAKAILMGLDSPIMNRIRKTDYLTDLVSYLSHAIWLSFTFCGISLLGYFIITTNSWYGIVWAVIGAAMAGSFIRVTNIMLKILNYNGE